MLHYFLDLTITFALFPLMNPLFLFAISKSSLPLIISGNGKLFYFKENMLFRGNLCTIELFDCDFLRCYIR